MTAPSQAIQIHMEEAGLNQQQLAELSGIPKGRISELLHGKRKITPELSVKLAKVFNITPSYLAITQTIYDVSEITNDT